MRGGRENDPRFGTRMSGEGIFAELQEQRFRLACERHGLNRHGRNQLDTTRFVHRLEPASSVCSIRPRWICRKDRGFWGGMRDPYAVTFPSAQRECRVDRWQRLCEHESGSSAGQ